MKIICEKCKNEMIIRFKGKLAMASVSCDVIKRINILLLKCGRCGHINTVLPKESEIIEEVII